MTDITRADPEDRGCWIDGHWGQYGIDRLIEIAQRYGFSVEGDPEGEALLEYSAFRLAHTGPSMADDQDELQAILRRLSPNTDDIAVSEGNAAEMLVWLADECESWLNENVAPEGFLFGWSDGEFFLMSEEDWQEGD